MITTSTRDYDIVISTSATDLTPRIVETIKVEVYPPLEGDEDQEEFLTPDSFRLIEERRAYHMGRLTGDTIRALRKRMNLTQKDLAACIKCAEKSLSRWESGRGFPSELVNTSLRLLEDGIVTPAQLLSVQGPRRSGFQNVFFEKRHEALRAEKIIYCDFFTSSSSEETLAEMDSADTLAAS